MIRSGESILPRPNINHMFNFLQAFAVAAEVTVCLGPKQGSFGKSGILPQCLITVLNRLLKLALIQKYFGSNVVGRIESRISFNHCVQAPPRRFEIAFLQLALPIHC